MYCCAHCRPCCLRACTKCHLANLHSPYMDEMWGNVQSALTEEDERAIAGGGAAAAGVRSPKVYPLSNVVKAELELDAERRKQMKVR